MPTAPDAVLDAGLDVIALADEMYVTDTEPAAYADIGTTVNILIGPITLTPGDGNGDFTIADGSPNGRTLTVAAQNGASVVASGTPGFVVLATGGGTDLIRYVTEESTGQALTSGNTANVGSWTVNCADPTSA